MTKSTLAYDYDKQTWINGDGAARLLCAQLLEHLALVRSDRGQAYLDTMRRKGEPRRMVADVLRDAAFQTR